MKTKVILEMGCNHQGQMSIAKQMINAAAKLGVWAVKFQKRDVNSIQEEVARKKRDPDTSFGKTYYEHRKALEFGFSQIAFLKTYAEDLGLVFFCSAFDIESVYGLKSIGCDVIKVPSQLYLDECIIKSIRECDYDLTIASCGMHSFCETQKTSYDVTMHCISAYPTKLEDCNLQRLVEFKESQQHVGYSSHDVFGFAIPFAVCLGAEYIERHFTLDKTWKGSDHGTVSSDPIEMARILKEIDLVEKMMGDVDYSIPGEEKNKEVYRA